MTRADLQKLMELCRNEADLELPEFQPLAESISSDPAMRQRWEETRRSNAAFRQVLRDVPVPVGLEAKLFDLFPDLQIAGDSKAMVASGAVAVEAEPAHLGFVTSAAVTQTPDHSAASATDVSVGSGKAVAADRTRKGFRWKTWSAIATGVAALLLIASWYSSRPEPSLATREDAVLRVAEWTELLSDDKWHTAESAPHAIPSQLRKQPVRWQTVSAGKMSVVCYDLVVQQPKARLFIATTRQKSDLGTAPPPHLYQSAPSKGWHLAAWKNDRFVYVLALQGGDKQYQSLIRPPQYASRDASRGKGKSCLTGKI